IRLLLTASLALVFGLLLAIAPAHRASAGFAPGLSGELQAIMTGAEEVPQGDLNGIGFARLAIDVDRGEICFLLIAFNIATPTAAHIHRAPPGVPGPIVIPLAPPTSGISTGCTSASRMLLAEVLEFPERFYANVHNAPFPAGAIRGQLHR